MPAAPVTPRSMPCTGWYRGGVWYQGGYTGWVMGEGYTGYPASLKAEADTSEAGPGSPHRGLEWWVSAAAPARAQTTHSDPLQGSTGPASLSGPLPASWPIGTRFDLNSTKLSQNDEVSPKSVEKASLYPYFQNGSQKSPLGFSRFPFGPAFSHKELIGHFDRYLDFIVKMTKCRPVVHTMSGSRRGRMIPPLVTAASCLL